MSCPNCGYCPTCGRSNGWGTSPYRYPYSGPWYGNGTATITTDEQINPVVTSGYIQMLKETNSK